MTNDYSDQINPVLDITKRPNATVPFINVPDEMKALNAYLSVASKTDQRWSEYLPVIEQFPAASFASRYRDL